MNKTYQDQPKKTVLVTGASSGIGYELAKLFARYGYNLILIARSDLKLAEIANEFQQKFGAFVKVIVKDLSIPTAPEEIFNILQQESIHVDVLVNNAGFGTFGLFHETDLTAEMQMLQVNLVCLTHLTKLFLKEMVKQGSGKILNVASTAAFQPGPTMAVYFATKAYVLSFSEAIAEELKGTGVTVTVLCPGPTASAFHQKANSRDAKLFSGKIMNAQTVSEIGYRGLMSNKTVVIAGVKNKLLTETIRFTPRNLVVKVVKSLLGRKN